MNDALRFACCLTIFAALVLPATAWPGDEDSEPGYMIYIDPETGKYTTEDPDVATHIVVPAKQGQTDQQLKLPWAIAGVAALALLLVVGLLKHQRRQVT